MFLVTAALLVSCDRAPRSESEPAEVIRLNKLAPLPAYQQESQAEPFRMAIAAVLSPETNASYYRPITEYFARALGRPVRLLQRRNYQEINDLLATGGVDVAFVCTGAYQKDKEAMDLLVVPQINGKTTYRALVIVPASSPVRSFEELRGRTFAFSDPLSQTGYLYPVSLLEKKGEQPGNFFAKTIFTYSHERSINAVMQGLVEAASVDHLVYDQMLARDKTVGTRTRVILESEDFGIPPVVVPASTPPAQREKIKQVFLHMGDSKEGEAVLRALGTDRFVEPDVSRYR